MNSNQLKWEFINKYDNLKNYGEKVASNWKHVL